MRPAIVLSVLLLAVVTIPADENYTATFSTYLGGTGNDEDHGDVAIDPSGNVYVVGFTNGSFPVTSGSYNGGNNDGWVAKYNAAGVKQWAYYYGTATTDFFLSANYHEGDGKLIVAGRCGQSLGTTGGVLQTSYDGYDNGSYGETNACIFAIDPADGSADIVTYWGSASAVRQLSICPDGDLVVCQGYDAASAQNTFPSAWSSGKYKSAPIAGVDGYVAKISSDLTTVRWGTYWGGSSGDGLDSKCTCDAAGAVYVASCTTSSDMDVSPAGYDTTYSAGNNDGWVGKLKADGTDLLWGTYHGGTAFDCPGSKTGLHINPRGQVVVVSITGSSSGFQTTTGAYDTSHNGGTDVHVALLGAADGSLQAATFFGGSNNDGTEGGKVCSTGEIVVAGDVNGTGLPTTLGAYDTTYNGTTDTDGYIAVFDRDLADVLYSSYFGSSVAEKFRGMACGPAGEVVGAGRGEGAGFPMVNADQGTHGGSGDAVITKLARGGRTRQ